MICCLGRPVAEVRYSGVSLGQLIVSNIAEIDVEMAEDALKRTTGSPPLEVAIAAARRVVEYEANRIDRVAIQLRRHGELDFDQCRRIAARR